jgi:hypothetical protein
MDAWSKPHGWMVVNLLIRKPRMRCAIGDSNMPTADYINRNLDFEITAKAIE